MATTTNYSWTTPDDTDLVKDGAAAIRTLGSSVDTTTKALNPSTTLGDIEYRSSTANTNTRLGIGTTGQVLSVSGGVPAWTTASANSMTLISSGSLTGSAVDLTSISGYNDLQLVLRDFFPNNSGTSVRLRVNADSATNYSSIAYTVRQTALDLGNGTSQWSFNDGANQDANSNTNSHLVFTFFDYANTTTRKVCQMLHTYSNGGVRLYGMTCSYNSPSAITELNLACNTGSFGGGTYRLYGIK